MKNVNTLVLTVNYNGVESFTSDYFKSIDTQDTGQFDLLIINDNVASPELTGLNISVDEIMIQGRKKPSLIRFDGIRYALKNGYNNLIFSDIDDYFSDNRISVSIEELQNNNFVFNEISLVNQNSELIEENYLYSLTVANYIESYRQIIDYNYLGLTNTGVNLKFLTNFYIPENIIAVDWWIFTILLLNGAKGRYIDNATTFYRQFDNNLVGIKKPLNEKRLETGIHVKYLHYHHIHDYCNENNLAFAAIDYGKKKNEMLELKSALEDKEFQKRYIEVINANLDQIFKGWWSEIVPLNDWRVYEN